VAIAACMKGYNTPRDRSPIPFTRSSPLLKHSIFLRRLWPSMALLPLILAACDFPIPLSEGLPPRNLLPGITSHATKSPPPLTTEPATIQVSRNTQIPTPAPTGTTPFTPSAEPTHTQTYTPTQTQTPTESFTPPPSPTYAVLRGEVLELSNCRYGPGAMYLYKYALIPGSNLEVFGRIDSGDWILVRAIAGTNPCWVKASLMDLKGDVLSVESVSLPLPQSPYYGQLTGVSAARDGDRVTLSWNGIQLRAGDETASPIHLVEAWVCRDGEMVFIPLGTDADFVVIEDQTGCPEQSHARVYGVEKHGYTNPVEISWPAHPR
jgi:hypothetical protein